MMGLSKNGAACTAVVHILLSATVISIPFVACFSPFPEVFERSTTTINTRHSSGVGWSLIHPRRLRYHHDDDSTRLWLQQDQEGSLTIAEERVIIEKDEGQEFARMIAKSFTAGTYKPIPWMSNCHVQSILGLFTREVPECRVVTDARASAWKALQLLPLYKKDEEPSESCVEWDWREAVDTPDGDAFYVDHKNASAAVATPAGTFLLLHGLESSSQSSLAKDFLEAFHGRFPDWNVACVNFRSCCPGTEPNRRLGGYHLGFTDDIKFYLETRHSQLSQSSTPDDQRSALFIAGYSLGGNVVLKAMGELGKDAMEKYNIVGAGAYCVPLNCEAHYPFLSAPGFNRLVYTQNLLLNMKAKAKEQLEQFCNNDPSTDTFDFPGTQAAETIMDFEDAFICPLYGFDDFLDYYRKTSSIYFVKDIAVPTLILNAADDPFMNPDYWPVDEVENTGSPVRMIRTQYGGHCGHMFEDRTQRTGEITERHSFGPSEMSRFLHHILEERKDWYALERDAATI